MQINWRQFLYLTRRRLEEHWLLCIETKWISFSIRALHPPTEQVRSHRGQAEVDIGRQSNPVRALLDRTVGHYRTWSAWIAKSKGSDWEESPSRASQFQVSQPAFSTTLQFKPCGSRSSFPRRDRIQKENIDVSPYRWHVRSQPREDQTIQCVRVGP